MIDTQLERLIFDTLDGNEASMVIDTIRSYMLETAVQVPANLERTRGDWNASFPFTLGDYRPNSALSYNIIREMLRSGVVRFALEMKRAQMLAPFRNKHSIIVVCANEELANVGKKAVEMVLPHMAYEFSWSALVYGSAFMELLWENKTAYELGLSKGRTQKSFTVPRTPNLVPHETVGRIMRTKNGDFNGFTQIPGSGFLNKASLDGDIKVPVDAALVIPYNGYSRNLWGESFLKPIYPLWFWYEIVVRATVQFSQMMGDPPRLGKAPSHRKVRLGTGTQMIDAMDYLLAVSANMPKTNSVVIPSDVDENGKPEWELAYMQIPDRSQPLVQIIEEFSQLILRAALTGDTASAASSGAQSVIAMRTNTAALHDDMVVNEWLHYLNKYWMPQLARYNLGASAPPIWLEIEAIDPKEREFFTSIMGISGNSATFQEFFYQVDWQKMARLAGMPTLTRTEAEALKERLSQEGAAKRETAEEPPSSEIEKKMELFVNSRLPLFFDPTELGEVEKNRSGDGTDDDSGLSPTE